MKFVVATVLTALLGFTIVLFMPWWSVAITSLIVALAVSQKPLLAFLAGFAGIFILWGTHAFIIDYNNKHILAPKVAEILHMGSSSMPIILISGIAGGLVAGCAAVTGSFSVNLTRK